MIKPQNKLLMPKVPQKLKILKNKTIIYFRIKKYNFFILSTLTVYGQRRRHCTFLGRPRPGCTFPGRQQSASILQIGPGQCIILIYIVVCHILRPSKL